ncbi:hypothetical protein HIM_12299 [Hirsutella minnesotensis 3608]|uniref:Uncharacterized protein n=1 Tax=Hirsutella minnesotensis 3608 TaxID=1043627 RepID=A0A0F7ZQR2_9HYPO|nr:hypothetical protein HIM_12299 [Hirsutella minnesotensis 3608]
MYSRHDFVPINGRGMMTSNGCSHESPAGQIVQAPQPMRMPPPPTSRPREIPSSQSLRYQRASPGPVSSMTQHLLSSSAVQAELVRTIQEDRISWQEVRGELKSHIAGIEERLPTDTGSLCAILHDVRFSLDKWASYQDARDQNVDAKMQSLSAGIDDLKAQLSTATLISERRFAVLTAVIDQHLKDLHVCSQKELHSSPSDLKEDIENLERNEVKTEPELR